MPQDFYTLEEAARRLGVSEEQMLQMARPGVAGQPPEVRSFMDRGSPRFRKNEIDEVARRRGLGSDTDVPLRADHGGTPATGDEGATEVFPFELAPDEKAQQPEEDTDIFAAIGGSAPRSAESEVQLVLEGSDLALQPMPGDSVTQRPADSASKIGGRQGSDESAVPLGREFEGTPSESEIALGTPGTKSGRLPPDSGVRLVEDWLVAKEQVAQSGLSGTGLEKGTGPKSTPPSGPKSGPKVTPFGVAGESGKTSPKPPPAPPAKAAEEGSSEFELTPLADFEPSDSVFDPSSVDQPVIPNKGAPKTQAGDDEAISFELTPDKESSSDTQRRKKAKAAEKAKPAKKKDDSSSEFDLTPLKDAADSSSSEFELSLEEEEGLAPLEETKAAPPFKKKSSDVELKPIEEEDTSVEGSDFELALEEEPEAAEGDTGSEVVVIEEETEEPAGRRGGADVVVEDEGEELVVSAADEEEQAAVAAVSAPPAEWGWWSLIHLPTTLLLLFSGFLLLEMMRSIWSYNEPSNPVSGAVFKMINSMFK